MSGDGSGRVEPGAGAPGPEHGGGPRVRARVPTTPRAFRGPALAYFLTWTTYGTWLPGDARGSVTGDNRPGAPYAPPDAQARASAIERMRCPPIVFSREQRDLVDGAIREHVRFRGWHLHALSVRTNHVHAVLTSGAAPEDCMGKLKSRASRVLRESGVSSDQRIWTTHGSTRYLDTEASVAGAVRYVLEGQ